MKLFIFTLLISSIVFARGGGAGNGNPPDGTGGGKRVLEAKFTNLSSKANL